MKDLELAAAHRAAPLKTPTRLSEEASREITGALNMLLADVFAIYLKTSRVPCSARS